MPKKIKIPLVIRGILNTVVTIFGYISIELMTLSVSSVLKRTTVFLTPILAFLIVKEKNMQSSGGWTTDILHNLHQS